MQKILKLTGVSMLAIVATTNANAAGYTCEELVEYTSCNDGWYLTNGKCEDGASCGAGNYIQLCPKEYYDMGFDIKYGENWCEYVADEEIYYMEYYEAESQEECESRPNGRFLGTGCYLNDGAGTMVPTTYECTPCTAGTYQPLAGQTSCTTCPAGSECATEGLTTHTLCDKGSYSLAGATACSTCPTHSYINDSGQIVTVSASSDSGAGSASECYIDPDTHFTDVTGTYHFKQNCKYSSTEDTDYEDTDYIEYAINKALCERVGGTFAEDETEGTWCEGVMGSFDIGIPYDEYTGSCGGDYYVDANWDGSKCLCDGLWKIYYNGEVYCQ